MPEYYLTIGHISDLSADEMSYAQLLTSTKASDNTKGWDNVATIEGWRYTPISPSESLLATLYYSFHATEGATYDIVSTIYYDPADLYICDQYGNFIEVNSEGNDASDNVDYFSEWVAPYTGIYYVGPDWTSDFSSNRSYSLSIYEDVDTIITESVEAQASRIFDWLEYNSPVSLLHTESYIISDYYARLYPTNPGYSELGDIYGLGEKDGNIYFYDGLVSDGTDPISLVGTVPDLLTQAMAEGF